MITYHKFDIKYKPIQKSLPCNEKQTNLYLFYYLESLVEVRVGVPLFPSSPSYFDSLRTESLEYRSKLVMTTSPTLLERSSTPLFVIFIEINDCTNLLHSSHFLSVNALK